MWSPVHPALFACVDGMGRLDLWNLNNDTEVGEGEPRARREPSGAGRARQGRAGPGRAGQGRAAPPGRMIGVNSINSSAGRMRSRSMCSVRYGRNYRGVETFCYGWPQRSRTLKPVLYTDLVVSRLQSRRKKKPVSAGTAGKTGGLYRQEPARCLLAAVSEELGCCASAPGGERRKKAALGTSCPSAARIQHGGEGSGCSPAPCCSGVGQGAPLLPWPAAALGT